MSSGAFPHKSSSKRNEVKRGKKKKGILSVFKEKKINARNIKTSQFREEVLLFSVMKEELQLVLATRGRGTTDHNDILSLACERGVYVTKKHAEKTLEWYLEAAYLQNSSSCEKYTAQQV